MALIACNTHTCLRLCEPRVEVRGDRSRAAKNTAGHKLDMENKSHAPTRLACTLTLKVTKLYMPRGG